MKSLFLFYWDWISLQLIFVRVRVIGQHLGLAQNGWISNKSLNQICIDNYQIGRFISLENWIQFLSYKPRNFDKIILFNLLAYLILTDTPTLTPQLSPNPNRKPQIKCAKMNIAHCSFSLFYITFSGEIVTLLQKVCANEYSVMLFFSLQNNFFQWNLKKSLCIRYCIFLFIIIFLVK